MIILSKYPREVFIYVRLNQEQTRRNVFRDSQKRRRRGRKEERWCVEYFGNELVIVRAAPQSRRKAKDNHIKSHVWREEITTDQK